MGGSLDVSGGSLEVSGGSLDVLGGWLELVGGGSLELGGGQAVGDTRQSCAMAEEAGRKPAATPRRPLVLTVRTATSASLEIESIFEFLFGRAPRWWPV